MGKTTLDLDFALESGKMGTWDIDLRNDTVMCSREMLRIWNVSELEFQGNRSVLQAKVHPDDRPRMIDAINKAIHEQSVYELEYRIYPTPEEMRWVMSRGRCTFDPATGKALKFAGVVFDITESKLKEEALSQAIKARDQFFMIASHELKTPLACLNLQTEVFQWELKEKFSDVLNDEMIISGLRKQQEHLFRISRIVENILSASKLSDKRFTLQTEKVELNEMVHGILERFQVAAEAAKIEIRLDQSKKIHGEWDRYGLEQVILNLLMNAIKYGKDKPIKVNIGESAEHAFITVKDEGIGISENDQARIFERFERVQADNKINGLGLGLFISKSIVAAHDGEIRLKSELDKGSEFTVILPRN